MAPENEKIEVSRGKKWARRALITFLVLFSYVGTLTAYAYRWSEDRQSVNMVDYRDESNVPNLIFDMEEARKYILANVENAKKATEDGFEDCSVLKSQLPAIRNLMPVLNNSSFTQATDTYICNPSNTPPTAGWKVNLCSEDAIDYKKMSDTLTSIFDPEEKALNEAHEAALTASKVMSLPPTSMCVVIPRNMEKKMTKFFASYAALKKAIQKLEDK